MSAIILGLWPIAGITSGPVPRQAALATIQAAIDCGIDTFDTAFSYGYSGESDRLLGEVLRRRENRERRLQVIGKVGQRWTDSLTRVIDASPDQLIADTEESLRRIGIQCFDWLMLHSVDPQVPVQRSAEAIDSLRRRGLASRVGVCNATVAELAQFANTCPCAATQCPLNLLQPQALNPLIKAASSLGAEAHVYWTLMKGLLAGAITRDHVFAAGDSRPKYDVFRGVARRRAHEVVDQLMSIAKRADTTVARLSIGWALSQPGVAAALVGARAPDQIRATAGATRLDDDLLSAVNQAAQTYFV